MKEAVLDNLDNRLSGIADCIQALFEEGYIPSTDNRTVLNWSAILIHAFENIDVLSKEQHTKIERIYNKLMRM